jgi:hypothetical protein
MLDKRKYQAKVDAQLLAWDQRVETLRHQVVCVGIGPWMRLQEQFDELDDKRQRLKSMLADLKACNDVGWSSRLDDIEEAQAQIAGDLRQLVESVRFSGDDALLVPLSVRTRQ